MTNAERIVQDIATLRASISLGWQEIAAAATREEADALRQHIKMCLDEMSELYQRLEK